MFGQKYFLFKNNVFIQIERNGTLLPEVENFIAFDGINIRNFRVDGFGLQAHQPVDNCLDRSMTETGQSQRAV